MKNMSEEVMCVEKAARHLHPYEWAKREWQKDIKEIGGKEHNPRIVWYHFHTTLRATDDETPWCSAFFCAAAEACGFKSTRSAAAKSWLDYGIEGDGSVGDIAVFKRGTAGHHVAFINKPFKKGERLINVLGGNQGNAVSIMDYKAENLIAIRRFNS